jgi:hypothetical protein
METRLPARPFSDEWKCLKEDRVAGWRGRYAELGTVERVGPVVYAALFIVGLAGGL